MRELFENAVKGCNDMLTLNKQIKLKELEKLEKRKNGNNTLNSTTNSNHNNNNNSNNNTNNYNNNISLHSDEGPLESSPIYIKFRGLGFRMRELSALLKSNEDGKVSAE